MAQRTPKEVVVSEAAVKKAGIRATKASAKLEGREVPPGHRRSAAVNAYLAKQKLPKRAAFRVPRFPGAKRLLFVIRP